MSSIQLLENEALVRAVHVAAWTPFPTLIKGGAEFGAHRVWFLG